MMQCTNLNLKWSSAQRLVVGFRLSPRDDNSPHARMLYPALWMVGAMELLQITVFISLCAVALCWVARHFNFPYPIALVIGGGVLGFIPLVPQLAFDPELILALVLPPILYQAAALTSWRDFAVSIRTIGLLAIGLVVVTTL